MNLIFHRRTNNVDGTCVELINKEARMILDIGVPLNLDIPEGDEFRFLEQYRPKVKGLYKDSTDTNLVTAVIVSHFHPTHRKFLADVHPKIPVYLSEEAFVVMKTLEIFNADRILPENYKIIDSKQKMIYSLGDFTVQAVIVDNTALGALGFIIKCGGRTVVYTGGLIAHGTKDKNIEYFKKEIQNEPDLLMIEGTMAGSPGTEQEINNILMNTSAWPVLINARPVNLDYIMNIVWACKRAQAVFVIDLLTAYIYLEARALDWDIPDLRQDLFNVIFIPGQEKALKDANQTEFLAKVFKNNIKVAEIAENKRRIVMFRPEYVDDYGRKKVNLINKTMIYSQYDSAYPGQEAKLEEFNEYISKQNIRIHNIPESSPSYTKTLKSFIEDLHPRMVVPVQTSIPEKLNELFECQNIRLVADGDLIRI